MGLTLHTLITLTLISQPNHHSKLALLLPLSPTFIISPFLTLSPYPSFLTLTPISPLSPGNLEAVALHRLWLAPGASLAKIVFLIVAKHTNHAPFHNPSLNPRPSLISSPSPSFSPGSSPSPGAVTGSNTNPSSNASPGASPGPRPSLSLSTGTDVLYLLALVDYAILAKRVSVAEGHGLGPGLGLAPGQGNAQGHGLGVGLGSRDKGQGLGTGPAVQSLSPGYAHEQGLGYAHGQGLGPVEQEQGLGQGQKKGLGQGLRRAMSLRTTPVTAAPTLTGKQTRDRANDLLTRNLSNIYFK